MIVPVMKAADAIMIAPTVTVTPEYVYSIEVLDFVSPAKTAEAGTGETDLYITAHGLAYQDMVVNVSCKATSDGYGNRGSRFVADATNPNVIELANPVTGQAVGNNIRLYHYTDHTGLLKPGTFRLTQKGAGQDQLDFQANTGLELGVPKYLFKKGQFIRVIESYEGVRTYVFWGVVMTHDEEFLNPAQNMICQTVSCQGLNAILSRRTIEIDEDANTNYQAIVNKMITQYLYSEGITAGTVDAGAVLAEDWNSDAISIKDVMDECASKSGFIWYVDNNGALHFYRQLVTVPDAPQDLDSGWSNYSKLKFSSNSSEYYNKIFFVGGVGEARDTIKFARDDNTELDAQQNYAGGTGAFGSVIHDTALTEADYKSVKAGSTASTINITNHAQNVGDTVWNYTTKEYRTVSTTPTADQFTVSPAFSSMALPTAPSVAAEAGTTTTNIKITAHGRTVLEMIKNETRGEYRLILAVVDADNITVAAITGQVATDSIRMGGHIIAFFGEINNVLNQKIIKQSIDPTTVSFSTPEKFEPLTKLTVNLPAIGQATQVYLIEDVEIYDIGKGLGMCWYNVKGTKRNATTFSSQRKNSYLDYWRDF